MRKPCLWVLMTSLELLAGASCGGADGDLRTGGLENLALGAQLEASSSAGQPGAKYGIDSANDGDLGTWWASAAFPSYPITLTLTFAEPVTLDALAFIQADNPSIYTNWKTALIAFGDGTSLEQSWPDVSSPQVVRFDRREVQSLIITIVEPHDRDKHYVTLREVMAFLDPDRKVAARMPPSDAWKHPDVTPRGRATHPCVYLTPEDVTRARGRLETEEWARTWFAEVRRQADEWAAKDNGWFASVLPEPGACFAYVFTGCPICRASWGTWGGARCSFDHPGHVTCANGHVLPDAEHPDEGTGYRGPDGRIHYFVGSHNAWVVETLQFRALQNLAYAHTLTGEERYAEKAALILDLLADIYPSCDKGSWDYPSSPPSGRFCRPWYQVARVLIHFVDWYDQIYHSPALDRPSVREGLTRRRNIETNLLQNGATYCYTQSLKGRLHNGEADYIRGALAVGCCLDIPWYIDWAYDGPYGILNLVRNNVDRDGRYFETSAMYADHTRNLYLTFAEPLLNYRSAKYPQGLNLYDDPQFQRFYVLPELSLACIGKTPRYGDSGPDTDRSPPPEAPRSQFDLRLAERLYARVSSPEARARFGDLIWLLSGGDVGQARAGTAEMPWLLFHGADPPEAGGDLDPVLQRRIAGCNLLGQKGMAILRAGEGEDAQAALLRYGPTLNHGHFDDLNLNYYALGYDVTYDLGYGLGSTHTQVGWAKQTASHNLVLVDETPQGANGSGTGGSLHYLADLPGLKLAEASSEASYAQQGVTTYRRMVALVGEGPQSYLVDVFRVLGGRQHDYLLHSLGQDAKFADVGLGAPEPGSLAGPEVKWGELQLNDGDMPGHPNQPYWNPPPGNGLGFLMAPQRAQTDGPWSVTWPLPSGDAFVKLTILGQPGTEVISAWAPGIYPTKPKARYAIARRRSMDEPLSSTFVAVVEPHARRTEGAEQFASPFIESIEALNSADASGALASAGLRVTLDPATGLRDLIATAGHPSRVRLFMGGGDSVALQGHFGHLRFRGEELVEAHMVGARGVTAAEWDVVCREAEHSGTVRAVDEAAATVDVTPRLPDDGRLDGSVVLFDSDGYSRNTAHRIARVEPLADGSRIVLESPSLVLGTGILEDDPDSATAFTSLLAHEYARSDSVTGTQFFSGKLIRGDGFATTIVRTDFGQVMRYTVESTAGMRGGAEFVICDVQPGDGFRIPTVAAVRRRPDGSFAGSGNTVVSVRRGGQELARIEPVRP